MRRRAEAAAAPGGTSSGVLLFGIPSKSQKTIPKGALSPFEDLLMYFFKAHTLGRQSHMRCDKVGNYVSLSAHQRTNGRRACPCAAVRVVRRRPLAGTASCAGLGANSSQHPLPRPRPGWKGTRPWGSFKCGDMSGLSLILLCSVFMETCVYGKLRACLLRTDVSGLCPSSG